MERIIFVLLFCFLLCACKDTYTPPHLMYRAERFDTQHILEIEELMRHIAKKWDLQVVEKDREEMKVISSGQEAFVIFLLHNDEWFLDIGNAGTGTVLDLMAYDHGQMPVDKLERLTEEIKSELESRFNLKFCATDPKTSMCK